MNDNSVEYGVYILILHFTSYGMWVVTSHDMAIIIIIAAVLGQ